MSIRLEFHLDLAAVSAKAEAAVARGVQKGLEHIGEVSRPLVPVERGLLRDSQHIEAEGDHGSIGYYTDYAVYVEEILTNKHPHGQAKYLGQPMETEAQTAIGFVADEVREAL